MAEPVRMVARVTVVRGLGLVVLELLFVLYVVATVVQYLEL